MWECGIKPVLNPHVDARVCLNLHQAAEGNRLDSQTYIRLNMALLTWQVWNSICKVWRFPPPSFCAFDQINPAAFPNFSHRLSFAPLESSPLKIGVHPSLIPLQGVTSTPV